MVEKKWQQFVRWSNAFVETNNDHPKMTNFSNSGSFELTSSGVHATRRQSSQLVIGLYRICCSCNQLCTIRFPEAESYEFKNVIRPIFNTVLPYYWKVFFNYWLLKRIKRFYSASGKLQLLPNYAEIQITAWRLATKMKVLKAMFKSKTYSETTLRCNQRKNNVRY